MNHVHAAYSLSLVFSTPAFSPGLGVVDYNDQVFEKYCRDSDLFVYICNGTATLERTVSTLL